MSMHWFAAAAALATAGACATGGSTSGWTQASWASQAVKSVTQGPYAFSASPYGEDGFKLTLTIRRPLVSVQSGVDMIPDDEALRAAAEAAAPNGCKLKSVARTETGDAVADYDCDVDDA